MYTYNVNAEYKLRVCQMCIKTGWVQLYNDLVCPEKINYIDNKMFGIGQNNEVNEEQCGVWQITFGTSYPTSRSITKSKTLADILQSRN